MLAYRWHLFLQSSYPTDKASVMLAQSKAYLHPVMTGTQLSSHISIFTEISEYPEDER